MAGIQVAIKVEKIINTLIEKAVAKNEVQNFGAAKISDAPITQKTITPTNRSHSLKGFDVIAAQLLMTVMSDT